MNPFLIVGGVLLLYYFFKSGGVAQVTCGNPPFCKPDYTPSTVGVAPEWLNAPDLQKRIRFFIDPTTGCMIQNSGQLSRVVTYVTLLDPKQVAAFRCINGLRAPTGPQGIDTLGGIGVADTGLTREQLAGTQTGGTSSCGCCSPAVIEPPSPAVVIASSGTGTKQQKSAWATGRTGAAPAQNPYVWNPVLGYVSNPNYPGSVAGIRDIKGPIR